MPWCHTCRQHGVDCRVAGPIRIDRVRAEINLAFAVAGRISRRTGKELDRERARCRPVERSLNVDVRRAGGRRHQDGKVL